VKLRNGLHESGDGHLHVSGREYRLYETRTGDVKLVPRRSGPQEAGASTVAPRRPPPREPRGGAARPLGRRSR